MVSRQHLILAALLIGSLGVLAPAHARQRPDRSGVTASHHQQRLTHQSPLDQAASSSLGPGHAQLRSGKPVTCRIDGKPRGLLARCRALGAWASKKHEQAKTWAGKTREKAKAWFKADPRRKWMLPVVCLAGGGVLLFAYSAAPLISAGLASWLTPTLGASAAKAIGAGIAGSTSSALGSLWAHGFPMALRIDPVHPRQLATDVGLSAGFNLLGFAQANLVKQAAAAVTGWGGMAAELAFAGGYLVGWEMIKHRAENHLRNDLGHPTDPKHFWRVSEEAAARGEKPIWGKTLLMILATNAHRFLVPGLEDNALAKVAGDAVGRPWWDRIVNARNPGNEEHVRARLHGQRGRRGVSTTPAATTSATTPAASTSSPDQVR